MLPLFNCNRIRAPSYTPFCVCVCDCICLLMYVLMGASVFSKTAKLFVIVSEAASVYLTIPEFRCNVNIIMIWNNEKRMPEKQLNNNKSNSNNNRNDNKHTQKKN